MRVPVELRRAYRLINHGPTTIVTAAAGAQRNVMAAAWVMPLDFEPARVAVVISKETLTRQLVDASGELVLNLPTAAQIDLVYAVGKQTGHHTDKFALHDIAVEPAAHVAAPLLSGCAAWLECRVVREPDLQLRYDLFVLDVLAAWADDRLFSGGRWHFPDPSTRTVHHVMAGLFFATGDPLEVTR
jgi:flavin reductase (DIM6/NTAB) family NADH-FMN oxidoreductase RutF